MERRPANDAVELCNPCRDGIQDRRQLRIGTRLDRCSGGGRTIGKKSCEDDRDGMEVVLVAISGSVYVTTGASDAEVRVVVKVERQPMNDAIEPCKSCDGGREGREVRIVAIFGSVHVLTAAVGAARHVQASTSENDTHTQWYLSPK